MSIATGNIITAKDVQEKILGDITDICSRIDGGIFLADTLPTSITTIVDKPYLSNFLSSFNLLKEHIGNLSTFFGVTRGHLIELSGFYDYVASCFSEASDIRHAMYHVISPSYQWTEVDSVSYLNDFPDDVYLKNTPLLSSEIKAPSGPMTVGEQTRISCSDFRFNFSETGQGVSSIMDEYNKYSSISVGNLIDYSNFNNTTKQMYITQIISANHANGMFGILNLLNEEIGNILSCEYWWIAPEELGRKPFVLTINYYSDENGTTLSYTETILEFTTYIVKRWKDLNPQSQEQSIFWMEKNDHSRIFQEGSSFIALALNYPFENSLTLDLVPKFGYNKFKITMFNVEDTDYEKGTTTLENYWFKFNTGSNMKNPGSEDDPNVTHYVNNFTVANSNGLTVTTEESDDTTCKISGFPSASYISFDNFALWCNELKHTHKLIISIVDVNDNNSERVLLNYSKSPSGAYQTLLRNIDFAKSDYSKYVNGESDAIYVNLVSSSFPNSAFIGTEGEAITLKISDQCVRFKIKYTYNSEGSGYIGAREVYFMPLFLSNGQIINGGIEGITLH